jgi:hypothetical protein
MAFSWFKKKKNKPHDAPATSDEDAAEAVSRVRYRRCGN